jgi:hypothetical protein
LRLHHDAFTIGALPEILYLTIAPSVDIINRYTNPVITTLLLESADDLLVLVIVWVKTNYIVRSLLIAKFGSRSTTVFLMFDLQ